MWTRLSFLSALCFLFQLQLVFSSDKQVPPVMYEFLGEYLRLQPYMVSEQKFSDPSNAKEIQQHLDRFADISKRLSHSKRLSTSSFEIPAAVLQEHFAKLSEAFRDGKKPYARRMLNATIDGCSNCHNQVSSTNGPKWKFREDELKGSSFDKAEFRFTARHYDEALVDYNKYIRSPKPDHSKLETALKRKLFIFVRAQRSPEKGIASFKADLAIKQLPQNLKTELQGWISALKKVSLKKEDEKKVTAESLEALASKTIPPLLEGGDQFKPDSLVTFMYISGLIFNFINTHSEADLTPGLLYWLAICDDHLTQTFFFSLTDLYLKECISRFPKTPTARKCFNELESSTIQSFTGSKGTEMPADVKAMLDKYEEKLEPKRKRTEPARENNGL